MLTLYETFYKLSADPFRLSPDHRFSFGHRSYAKAKAYLEYALHRGEGFITITGSAGTGKTTLISEILAEIDRGRLQVATLTTTQLEGKDLLQMVAALFGLEYEDESKASLLLEIEEFLKQLNQRGRRAVLIVDEAQGLSPSAVEELRLLANLQFNHRLLLQVFLVGQEQLRDMVRAPAMEHLRQRIVAASHLEPLTLDEMVSYVEHRLMRVGWQGDPAITEDALRLIYRFSGGVPRRVNLICSRLFLYGSMEQKHELDGDDARIIIEDLQQELLVSADTAETPTGSQQNTDEVDQTEAPVRRLPRQTDRIDSGKAGGPGAGAGRIEPDGAGAADEADVALRERDIWGEIENLENELHSTSRGLKDEALLGTGSGSVAAAGQASVRSMPHNAVGVAVSKAMSRRARAGSAPAQARTQQPAPSTPARQARPRFHAVPPPAGVSAADEVTRPALSAEPDETIRRSRRQGSTAVPPRKRRRGLVLLLLMIGLGFAGAIGWQNLDRWLALAPETSGTIQRDSIGTPESGVMGSGTDSDAVQTQLHPAESLEPRSAATGEMSVFAGLDDPEPEPAGTDTGLAANRIEAAAGQASRAVTSTGSEQRTAEVAAVDDGQQYPAGAMRSPDETALALVQPQPVAPVLAEAGATSVTKVGDTVPPAAAEQATGDSQAANSIAAERARLRREAEQRFRQELGRAESQAAPESTPPSSSAGAQPDKAKDGLTRQAASVTAAVSDSKQRDLPRVPSTPAPKESTGPVPGSRPKTASAPVATASVTPGVVDVAPEPPRSPEQLRRMLLQGQWTSQGKPATLLPSDITFCSAAGDNIKCWSVPQKTNTKYGEALYKVEATLYAFRAEGGFELSYRTLVKLVDSAEVSDGPLLGGAADDESGWQVTERRMSCEFSRLDRVLCSSATGTVRDYRRVVSGGTS